MAYAQAPISYESSDPRTSKGVKVFGDSSCVSLGLRIVQEENTVHLPVFGVPVPFHFAYIHRVYTESTGQKLFIYTFIKQDSVDSFACPCKSKELLGRNN